MVAFVLLIWFVNKVLWGPVTKMMADRQKRIADGLAAADKGKHELARAEEHAKKLLSVVKVQAGEIIVQAEKRGNEIVEEAKHTARGVVVCLFVVVFVVFFLVFFCVLVLL